jgi:hypothetical protein
LAVVYLTHFSDQNGNVFKILGEQGIKKISAILTQIWGILDADFEDFLLNRTAVSPTHPHSYLSEKMNRLETAVTNNFNSYTSNHFSN